MSNKWGVKYRTIKRNCNDNNLPCGIQTLIVASDYIEKMASASTLPATRITDSPVKQETHHSAPNNDTQAATQAASQASTHTRTYQACLPCRNRKVRCDLGPVDNPHDPPCQRCRREQKECIFSATRRKRNPNEAEAEDAYEARNSRKRTRTGSFDPLPEGISGKPLTPQSAFPPPKPDKRSLSQQPASSDEDDSVVNNDTTAMLQQTEVFDSRDALNLLFEAADARGDIARHRSQSTSTSNRPVLSGDAVTTPQQGSKPMVRGASSTSVRPDGTPGHTGATAADQNSVFASSVEDTNSEGIQDAIKAWSSLRFVKAGLFTATEGIGYIDYFYRFLSPMTPVTVPDFHNPMKHRKLLQDEPMLAMTLLTIASRYVFPPGPGSTSRGIAIHERLWIYLQGMIDRMIWGQEQFGGGFCGAGSRSGGAEDGSRIRGLRSLGAIESLILLTEWHTRALHFPPGDDTDELIPFDNVDPANGTPEQLNGYEQARSQGRKIDSWLEPIYRSDRMSWSLLSNALALAYELGVYNKDEPPEGDDATKNPKTQRAIRRRFKNIKDLLFVYVTQISGRLNLPSMLQEDHRGDYTPHETLLELIKSKHQQEQINRSGDRSELVQDTVLYFWCRLSQMMKEGNRDLFPTRAYTRQLISSGRYVELIQRFSKNLTEWRSEFDACILIPSHMRHILNIEYEYIRVYVNCLALQAVVERCTNNTPTRSHAHLVKSARSSAASNVSKLPNETIPPSTLVRWLDGDRKYIRELVQASQNLLKSVIVGLLPGDYLKHASVRTYFRIISVSIILLKTFALGASEDDAATSLSLFDKAAEALRTCIVDDVHVGSRIAELLGTLTHRVRANLIRVAANGPKSGSASHPESRSDSKSPLQENNGFRTPASKNKASAKSPAVASGSANGVNPASLPNQRSVLGPPKYLQNQQQWATNNNNVTASNNRGKGYGTPSTFSGASLQQTQPQLHKSISPYMNRANLNYNNTQNMQPMPPIPSDPLYGISAYDYDPDNPAFSIMPPPSFNLQNTGNNPAQDHQQPVTFNSPTFSTASGRFTPVNAAAFSTASPQAPSSTLNNQQGTDWLALPLDPILNIYGADVTQGGYGPELGGTDMLDLLLNTDPSTFYGGGGGGPGSTGGGGAGGVGG